MEKIKYLNKCLPIDDETFLTLDGVGDVHPGNHEAIDIG
jgi:hypothetical protein